MIRKNASELWSPPIWVDFMARDETWRVPLHFPGTEASLRRHQIALAPGLRLTLFTLDATEKVPDDDLVALGTVEFDETSKRWVAAVDAETMVHVSELDDLDRRLYESARRRSDPAST